MDGPGPGVGVAFDGSDDTLPSTTALGRGANDAFTVEHWFRPQGMQTMKLLSIHNATDRDVVFGLRDDGHALCTVFDQGGKAHEAASGAAVSVGAWHHLACSYDGATQRVFVDGVLDGDTKWIGQLLLDDFVVMTGKGDLDEARLSSTAVYTATFTPPQHFAKGVDTILLWRLDEGVGIRSLDASGNGHDATLGLNAASPAWTLFER
jgi:hypothetical protein